MEVYLGLFSISITILAVAVVANQWRERQTPDFNLVPNCLLTRSPFLFITGPRSVFYFKSYWNIYPSYLAEHGYEVYTIRLPWRSRRLEALKKILNSAEQQNATYHLILDPWTWCEIKKLNLENASCIRSLSVLTDLAQASLQPKSLVPMINEDGDSLFQRSLYRLHSLSFHREDLPSLATLGGTKGTQIKNARLLLERARTLAEIEILKLS
jgi:hypothetical protein